MVKCMFIIKNFRDYYVWYILVYLDIDFMYIFIRKLLVKGKF